MVNRVRIDNAAVLRLAQGIDADTYLQEKAEEIRDTAKALCPVLTGHLRNSITVIKTGQGRRRIGTPVEYALYVEFGTKRQEAQPYLRPAIRAGR